MAAAENSSEESDGGGVAVAGAGARAEDGGGEVTHGGEPLLDAAHDGDCRGSSNPAAVLQVLPEKTAAAALAHVWKSNPSRSHIFGTAFGGIYLDDDIWDLRFNLDGTDNLERTMCYSDITYLNLLALIETEGYGINDKMYYVREPDIGVDGMELVDGTAKVEKMLKQYEQKKCLQLTVINGKNNHPAQINTIAVESQVPISEIGVPVVYEVNDAEQHIMAKGKEPMQQSEDISDDEQGDSDSEDIDIDMGEYRAAEHEEARREEEDELNQRICDLKKRKRTSSVYPDEGESEAEEIYYNSDCSSDDSGCHLVPELEPARKKKKPVRQGPTTRSHSSQQTTAPADYVPSDDEGTDGDLDPEDDDGFEMLSWALPKGRKSRATKKQPRQWYDEQRLLPHEGLCLKLCFVDVYQFRRAVHALHIAQLRNFRYHRNCKDRVIVMCTQQDCPFFMVGSDIKGEKTFCLRKMNLNHTCATSGEGCKVTCKHS
ncbi:unnamed protein product [Alopecurus aequalis]